MKCLMPKQFQAFQSNFNVNKKISLALFIFFIISPIPAFSESKNFSFRNKETRAIKIEEPLKTFTVGELLLFDVSWMGIPVGYGSLEVKEKLHVRGRDAFHVIAVARTNDFLSKIYPIYDEMHSYIDAEKFYSLEFRKDLKEGRYRADEKISYDHEARKGYYESFRNHGKKEITIPPGVHDFISAFFWFRLQPLAVGKSLHTVVNSEAENWDLEIMPLKIVTKQFRGGEVMDTMLIEPRTKLKGMLYGRGKALVYFTIDSRRAPVWITLQTPFGPVTGILRIKNP